MIFLFPSNPIDSKLVDDHCQEEWLALGQLGAETYLLSLEELGEGNLKRSTHRIPTYDQPVTALYRGWMLQKKSYALLESALREKKIYLLQPLEQYLETHIYPMLIQSLKV